MNIRFLTASAAFHVGLVAVVATVAAGGATVGRDDPPTVRFAPSPAVQPPEVARAPDRSVRVEPSPEPAPAQIVEPAIRPHDFRADQPDLLPRPTQRAPSPPADPTRQIKPRPTVRPPILPEPIPEPEATPPAPVAAFVEARALDSENLPPTYPREAIRRGWTGTVSVRLWIDADGRVTDARIIAASRYPVLNRAALTAARTWRFEPARRHGAAVASERDIPIEFQLVDR